MIAGLTAALAAQHGVVPQKATSFATRASAPYSAFSATRFIALPDGRFIAQAPDLNAEFFAGAYVRFTSRGADYALQLEGARETAVPVGLVPSPTRVSFLQGDEPADWRAGLPTFGALRYESVYPGIDMVYGSSGRLKSEFLVAPGANPGKNWAGQRSVRSGFLPHASPETGWSCG